MVGRMSGFCGSGDGVVTLRSGGGCFADLVLTTVPAILLVLVLPLYVLALLRRGRDARPSLRVNDDGDDGDERDALLPSAGSSVRWSRFGKIVVAAEIVLQTAVGVYFVAVLALQGDGHLPYPLSGEPGEATHGDTPPAAWLVGVVSAVAWIGGAAAAAALAVLKTPRPGLGSAVWVIAAICAGLRALIACESFELCSDSAAGGARRALWAQSALLWAVGIAGLRDLFGRAGARPQSQGDLLVDDSLPEQWWQGYSPLDEATCVDRVWYFFLSPLLALGRKRSKPITVPVPVVDVPSTGHAAGSLGLVTLSAKKHPLGSSLAADEYEIGPGDTVSYDAEQCMLVIECDGADSELIPLPPDPHRRAHALGVARMVAVGSDAAHTIPDTITVGPRGINREDLFPLQEVDSSRVCQDKFKRQWSAQLEKGQPKLWHALVFAFGGPFLLAAVWKFCYDTLQFVGPTVLQAMVDYVKEEGGSSGSSSSGSGSDGPAWSGLWTWVDDQWRGYWLVGILTVSGVVQTAVLHQYFFLVFRVGQRLRSAVVTAVYNKAMRLSASSRQKQAVGKIVNLMSADATRMQDLTTYLAVLWSGPYQAGVSLFFLGELLGVWPTLTGLAVALILVPINTLVSKRMKRLTQNVMQSKDARVSATNEALLSIKLVKCSAWEPAFTERIDDKRSTEIKNLRKYMYAMSYLQIFWGGAPMLVSLSAFGVWVGQGKELDAGKAFTAISLFNILRFPLNMLPNTINNIIEASVSLQRIQDFLMLEEIDENAVSSLPPAAGKPALEIHNGAFSWGCVPTPAGQEAGQDEKGAECSPQEHCPAVLSGVNVRIMPGQLVGVIGEVGSGKSSLLHAFLGELHKTGGDVTRRGRLAYVAQTPFIANMTLRENILWGHQYEEERYQRVLWQCCLVDDLQILPAGDMTEIGEAGINLSGGQRQRVSLARAVYSNADIYLLDDVLSAVDAHVGKAIFNRCIREALGGKTRVLVTHGVQYLPVCDVVCTVDKGGIAEQGSYAELQAQADHSTSVFLRIVAAHQQLSLQATGDLQEVKTPDLGPKQRSSRGTPAKPAQKAGAAFTKPESASQGRLREGTWGSYFRSYPGGLLMAAGILLAFVVSTGLNVLQNWYLSYWTGHTGDRSEGFFLAGYALVGVLYLVALMLRSLLMAFASTGAGKYLHERLLRGVMNAPMSFFYVTPTGRLLNRFSQDTYTLDEKLGSTLSMIGTAACTVGATIFVISLSTPVFLAVVPFMGLMYWQVQEYYIPLSREFKRLDAVSRSPIYSHFQESLVGVVTIRASGDLGRQQAESAAKLDRQQMVYFLSTTGNRWLAVRLESLGTAIVFFASLFVVTSRHSVPAGMAGLSISYALSVTQTLNWFVRMRSDLESQIVSAERVLEYAELESEPQDGVPAPEGWPSAGKIVGTNVTLRYRPELPPVLHEVDFTINPGEKIGVCGRTGAGKSSLFIALLRLAHPKSVTGTITIDGVDVSSMRLSDLRRRIAVIPQESQLFLGTIRSNLDPFEEHDDDAIRTSLRHVKLDGVVEAAGGLDAAVATDGENWSHGQRQLLCTARALLRGCKVVLLDEATAACDAETDRLLQDTFRQVFDGCTVISVAHRLHAIADSSRIIVLNRGNIEEFDDPKVLLSRPESLYRKLVAESAKDEEGGRKD
eukprot:TRINITY_DN277_c0_g2_i2.p1 TRINITY_DN277_c0_g2~~TRINITY_DN277_c0_g2_i2.p1  ORF type:complete len:1661 (+),score=534.27 TRINITY_DN277_c0_g2_i2:110-5092(+)